MPALQGTHPYIVTWPPPPHQANSLSDKQHCSECSKEDPASVEPEPRAEAEH